MVVSVAMVAVVSGSGKGEGKGSAVARVRAVARVVASRWRSAATVMAVGEIQQSTKKWTRETAMPLLPLSPLPSLLPCP